MRPVASGRPGTQVIPTGWAAAHETPAKGTMTAVVDLRLPGGTSEWSEEAQQTVTVPHWPYAAHQPARIQVLVAQGSPEDVVGETVHTRGYLVGLPASITSIAPGHLVRVTACDDASLIGRDLTVTDVLRGSLVWERDVFATLND